MDYPQLLLPEGFSENLDKVFTAPVKPTAPVAPLEPSKLDTLFGFMAALCLAAVLFFIKIHILGFVMIIVALRILFSSAAKNTYQSDLRKYKSDLITFDKAFQQYQTEIQITDPQTYQEYKKIQAGELILNSAALHIENTDYRKGVSQNYFKRFLVEHFNDSILENTSINVTRYSSYYQNEFKLYVTDFTYIDKYINLKINIEIDEPYDLEKKQPTHLDDKKRNDFFTQNRWVVIRFAEEQVVLYPELCCNFIKEVIQCFSSNYSGLRHLKTPLPKVQKWNLESAKQLIAQQHRNTYLEGRIYFTL